MDKALASFKFAAVEFFSIKPVQLKMIQGRAPHKNNAIHRISLCRTCIFKGAERNHTEITLDSGRGGEEGHVAIPSVTYTSKFMYHL